MRELPADDALAHRHRAPARWRGYVHGLVEASRDVVDRNPASVDWDPASLDLVPACFYRAPAFSCPPAAIFSPARPSSFRQRTFFIRMPSWANPNRDAAD
jgi:hypothetical protein